MADSILHCNESFLDIWLHIGECIQLNDGDAMNGYESEESTWLSLSDHDNDDNLFSLEQYPFSNESPTVFSHGNLPEFI